MERKFWTMKEIDALDNERYVELMPEEFLLDPERYLNMYADMEWTRYVHMVVCEAALLMPLNNGDRLHFHDFAYYYKPVDVRAANN